MTKYQRLVAASVLLAIVAATTSGCLGRTTPAEPGAPVAEGTAPEPTAVATGAPKQLFDGDCNQVLSAEEADSFFTSDVDLQIVAAPRESFYQSSPLAAAGGISCSWDSTSRAPGSFGSVMAVPSAEEVTPGMDCWYGPCMSWFSHSGVLFETTVWVGGGDELPTEEEYDAAMGLATPIFAELRQHLEGLAAGEDAPKWGGLPAGSWSTRLLNCESFEGAVTPIVGTASTSHGDVWTGDTSGEYFPGPLNIAYIETGNPTCWWKAAGSSESLFGFKTYPAQGFSLTDVGDWAESTPIDVPGTDAAYLVAYSDASPELVVQHGVNRLDVPIPDELELADVVSTITAVLPLLDATS